MKITPATILLLGVLLIVLWALLAGKSERGFSRAG